MDAVERSVLRDVHLDECAVVEEEARGDVRHVAASLHPLQEVVQLAPTLVEFQPGSVERDARARFDVDDDDMYFPVESIRVNFKILSELKRKLLTPCFSR